MAGSRLSFADDLLLLGRPVRILLSNDYWTSSSACSSSPTL